MTSYTAGDFEIAIANVAEQARLVSRHLLLIQSLRDRGADTVKAEAMLKHLMECRAEAEDELAAIRKSLGHIKTS